MTAQHLGNFFLRFILTLRECSKFGQPMKKADNLNEVYSIDLSDFQEFSLIQKKSIFKYMKKGNKSKTPISVSTKA
jgi:hypothetical protein